MDLHGTTALVTGAGSGIGLGIARTLARAGARLALTDVDADTADAAATELAVTTEAVAFALDVRDRDRFGEVVAHAEQRLGPIDVLCNNAGVAFPETVADMSYEQWDLMLGIDLGGVVNGIQTVLPSMIERGRPGHIVNTASAAGLIPAAGFAYTAAKYGVVGLSESLRARLEHEGHRVGVSVLCPGAVATDLARTSDRALGAQCGGAAFTTARRRIAGQVETMHDTLHRWGADPDRVGDLVTAAIAENRLYVFTDRAAEEMIRERFRAVLEAMPAGDVAAGSAEQFLERIRGRHPTAPFSSGRAPDRRR